MKPRSSRKLTNKKNSKIKVLILSILALLILAIGLFIGYALDYYEADVAAENLLVSTEDVRLLNESPIHFSPTDPSEVGVIFYPGGKVDETAYTPLVQPLAKAGYETFIADMPFNLAVFDIHAADSIIEDNPQIKEWYVGGHSLGAAMSAVYAESNVDKLAGLFLLAGYSTADLSNSNLPVLALYGTEDQVMDREKINEYHSNLPSNTIEIDIQGGNHAQFGMYGEQSGDGQATIGLEEQLELTVQSILDFIKNNQSHE